MKRKYYLLALFLLMGTSSCENYLETSPTDFLNPENYYETEEQLQAARASVYDALGNGALWGSYANYLLSWSADVGYMNRSSLTTGPWNYFYSSSDPYNRRFWSNLYSGINRANVLLANVDKNPELDQELRDGIRGEALFLRGYFYFLLVQYFGDVPLKTTPTESVIEVDAARTPIKEVYDQILSDMKAAEPLVPGIAELGYGGAVNKSAVRGMLARVCLVMAGEPLKDVSKYQEARDWAKKVMDDAEAGHALNPSYPQIFMNYAQDKYDIRESLFEAEFWGNRTDEYTETTNNAWINGPYSAATSATGRADSYMSITATFYNVFEPGDLRKGYSIAHFVYVRTSSINGEKILTDLPAAEADKYAMRPAKWRREFETLVPKDSRTTPQNVPLLRFSDILLMFAEAENEVNNGPTPAAIDAVNRVRQRAWSSGVKTITVTDGGSGYTSPPVVTFTGGDGSDAKATATIDGGKVTAITLDRDSTGIMLYAEGKYASPPAITISGGGGTGAAATATITDVNEANVTPEQASSKENFLELIQDERMREFNFEYLRKGDLLRWGIFLKVNQDMGNTIEQDAPGAFYAKYYSNVEQKHLLMPIPSDEVNVNQEMVQNPGW